MTDTLEQLEMDYQKIDRANNNIDNFLVLKTKGIDVEGVFEMSDDDMSGSSDISTTDIVDCWLEVQEFTRMNGLFIFDKMTNKQFVANFFPDY